MGGCKTNEIVNYRIIADEVSFFGKGIVYE